MITISKATKKETKEFDKTAWNKANIEHYGKPVQWKEVKFHFKAKNEEKIIATASGKFESGVTFINTLIVNESARKEGVGKMMIEKIAEWTKKLGGHKLWLFTGKNWQANKFYIKLGFKKMTDFPNHYFNQDFVIYSKSL